MGDGELDLARFDGCVSNSDSVADAADDMKLARTEGIHAVPTLIVGDQRIEGVRTLAELNEIIVQAETRLTAKEPVENSRTCQAIRN